MKLQKSANLIERSQKFEESNYTIEATAKAFSILSDGLYANKIRAVVRELSTNAYDSHIDAGRPDVPFEVHLPNSMEPHFSIRDFGTGLSHEDCMNLYTTYFRSNRTDSNKSVGCMGLGSKSPFAYNDSFTVESFYNGKHRTYNAYKNEQQEPVFALLYEKDTNEPNGLKVSLPVASHTHDNDFDRFSKESEELYPYFKVQPKITGQSIKVEPVNYLLRGEDWAVHDGSGSNWHCSAIMGQVCYEIDQDAMGDYPQEIKPVLMSKMDLFFEIGEINITPSRESLSYNDFTQRAIIEKCQEVLVQAADIVEQSIKDAETLWDARKMFVDIVDSDQKFGRIGQSINKENAEWQGQKLFPESTQWGYHISTKEIDGLTVVMYYSDRWKEAVQRDDKFGIAPRGSDNFIYVDDLKRGAIGRTKQLVKNHNASYNRSRSSYRVYLVKGSDAAIQQLKVTLGCKDDDILLASDLPKPDSSAYYSCTGARTKVAVWNGSTSSWKPADNWDDVTKDLKEGGYFVEINRYKYNNPKKQYSCFNSSCSTFQTIINKCDKLGISIDKIYGVKTAVMNSKKFRDLEKAGIWVNIFDKAEEVAKDYLDNKGYRAIIGTKEGRSDLFRYSNHRMEYEDVLAFSKLTETDNDLKNFMKLYEKEQVEDSEEYKAILTLVNCVDIKVEKISNGIKKEDFDKAEAALWEKYPLVKQVCHNFASSYFERPDDSIKELARYVDFMEKESKDEN